MSDEYNGYNVNNKEYNEENHEMNRKHKGKKGFGKFIMKAVGITAGGVVFGMIAGVVFHFYATGQGTTAQAEKNQMEVNMAVNNEKNKKDESSVAAVVKNVMPSIVAINTLGSTTIQDFFGRQYREEASGSGSGFIIGQNENEILIATNNHVINGATTIGILFIDKTTATATVKGTAPNSDLAVLSVDIKQLSEATLDEIRIATLGSSEAIELGDMAIAIGNALGYGQSVTVGYISALDREITVDNVTLKVLQTDAAINPGNSGGALLNSKGEVIGINSVKFVSDGVENIGYAIPVSEAIPIVNRLMNHTVLADSEKAYLGVEAKDITEVYSQRFNLPVGVYVVQIRDKSAAGVAGVKAGDIIVAVNDVPVSTRVELQEVLDGIKAGTLGSVTVKTLNNGEYVEQKLEITFDKRP